MFIDITPLWSWIPGWILSALNFGMTYPNGQVTPMHDLGEVWKWADGEMRKLEAELKAATEAALKHYEGGEGSAAMKQEFDKQFTGDNSVPNVASALGNLGDYTHEGMKALYQDQMWSALFAGMTTYSVFALIAEFWPFGMGAASVELVLSREALAVAEREAAELAAEEAAKAGLRNGLKPYLKKIGLQMDKWAGDSLARKAAVGGVRLAGAGAKAATHGAMADIGIQFISDPGGPIDWGHVGTSALTWGAGGMAGRAAGLGVSKGLGNAVKSDLGQRMAASANPVARVAVSPRTMGIASGLVSGAAGAVGMYGAMTAVDPNAKFSGQMLAAGFGMGALGGARMGSAAAVGATGTTAHGDGHVAKPAVVTPETSAEGKKLFRDVNRVTHPDNYQQPGSPRDLAEDITKRATQIKAEANVGDRADQYSDKHVAELRDLHQQGVQLASSNATTGHGGSTSGTSAEGATRTAGSGTPSAGANVPESGARTADSGARVAASTGDGSSARPAPAPERPTVQGQSERGVGQRGATDSGGAGKSRAGIAGSDNRVGGDTNLAAEQQDKPAPTSRAEGEAEARVPEQRAPEASGDDSRARPVTVDEQSEPEPRVPEQRRPDVPVDNSPARPVDAAEPSAPEAESGVSERRGDDAALADSGPRPPDDPALRQVDLEPRESGHAATESAVVPTESTDSDGSHAYAEDRPPQPAQAHPTPESFRVPEQRTAPESPVNNCVPEAFRHLEQAQGRPVAEGPAPQQRNLAGVPLHEVQRAIPHGKFEGFAPDRSSSGHAQIVDATMRAGKGASALVAEQRAEVNAGGAQGHVYTLTYKGDNHFEVNGKHAAHVETDAQGREWFVAADANGKPLPGHQPQSLAELAGGATRADAVIAEAVIIRAGEVVSGLGNPNAVRLAPELMMGATTEPRPEVRSLHAEYRHAFTEEARARAESTRVRAQAQQAREAGRHGRAIELDEQVRRLDDRADAAGTQADLLRARVVGSEQAKLAEQQQAVQTQIRELKEQLTAAIGDPEQVRQFSTDLELIDRVDVATQERNRVDGAQRELRNQMEPIQEQLESGRTAVRELEAQVRTAEAPGTALTPVERGELARATGPALARAQATIDWLQGIYGELEQRHGELVQQHDALTGEMEAATQARDRVAATFDVRDPRQLHPSYRGVPSPGTELVHSLRDAVDRSVRAQDAAARLADRQLGLRALDEMGLLPISDRVGIAPAAEPSTAFPDQRIVVVGTDTSPAGYRQALQATLRPGTDLELVLRLAESDKLPLQVEFVRVEVAEQGATGQALASTAPTALEKSGVWPEPRKHARPWEKTKWTEPQPPFLFKVSMVPVFDKIMAPFHHFEPGEVPAFLFPQNLPFSKTIYDVPEGVHAFQSDVGMNLFHLRILSLGILDRIPNHPWVRQFVQNRPWIGKVILGVTTWLPANTAHGRSVHVPLSVDFVNRHPRIAFALGGVEQWIPSVRNGRWIHLVPMIRGTRTHAWFDDARPDPAPLHRADLARPSFSPEAQHLDGGVTRPYTGESVEIPGSLAQRWHANEQARERIQEWTEGEYDRFERNRVEADDSLVHRIADQAAEHPDRYSGGDRKRWVRGKSNEWVRDPDGALLPRHSDGSTWLRDAQGNVRPHAEIVTNLQRARDHLMRNSELNRIPDVAELWNRLIDGNPLREDVIGLEAAVVEADHLATRPEATGQQAHQAAKRAGYDWDSNRPHLTGDRAERTLPAKLTGRRPLSVGATTELDPYAPDPMRTRRFGTTLYYGRHFGDFGQVRGQLGDIMHGWPAAKIARAQAEVVELTYEATRSHRGDHGLARGGVHVSGQVTGAPGRQRLVVEVESDGDGRQVGVRRYTLEESDGSTQRALPAVPTGAIAAGSAAALAGSAVNNCVPMSLGQVNADQHRDDGGDVVDVPDHPADDPAGMPVQEVQPYLRGAELEGFAADANSTGHGRLAEGLIHTEGAGEGATAWVLDQRTTVDEHGVGAHSYAVTYVRDNGDGTHLFQVDGVEVTYTGLDADGREWFVTADGDRVSLAELTNGSRAETAATWAAVWHDGHVVENVGDRGAPAPQGSLRVGSSDEHGAGRGPEEPTAHSPPTASREGASTGESESSTRRAEIQQSRDDFRDAFAAESRARNEATRLQAAADSARTAGDPQRAQELQDRAGGLQDRADQLHSRANGLRVKGIRLELTELADAREAVQEQIRQLENQLTDALGSSDEVREFQRDVERLDLLDGAIQDRDRSVAAAQQVRDFLQVAEEQRDKGRDAVRELSAALRELESGQPGTEVVPADQKHVQSAEKALVRAQFELDRLDDAHAELTRRHQELLDRHPALVEAVDNATNARQRLADRFGVADPAQLSPSYREPSSSSAPAFLALRDTLGEVNRAGTELARLAEQRAHLLALNSLELLPISDRVGVVPATRPSALFPYERIVVLGTGTAPAEYRQALQRALPPGTDSNLVLGLAKSEKLPLEVRFVRLVVDEHGRFQEVQQLPSTDAGAVEKSGGKARYPGKWTDPQPPFLFKVSMVPVFDELMAPFHDFAPGEYPEFIFPQNLPFSKTVFFVPEGVDAWQSPVGMDLFHARILSLGILDRIPNHPWVQNLIQNRPWIGRAILSATKWLPADTAHGKSVQVPLSADFVRRHPRIAFALDGVTKWIPAVRGGRWIHLVPMIRGTRTHAWFDDAQPDPQRLHRAEIATPPRGTASGHLDGSVQRPYTGESVEIADSLRARWQSNEQARERIQEWTQGEYDRFERNRVDEGDSFVHRIAEQAARHPDRYSGGDPKRWVRGTSKEWVRDPNGSLLPRHSDGSTWLRDAGGNVRPEPEIIANLRSVRDHLMRNSELNRIGDVAEMWNRLIDGKPSREDIVGFEAALTEAQHLASHPEATSEQAHQVAKKAGYDWDANRPQLTGDRAGRSLWGKLTGRRPLTVGFTPELNPHTPDAALTRRFGTTLYYGRQGHSHVTGQLGEIMHGWPEGKIAEAQTEVRRLTKQATQSHTGDHGLARGGVHVSAKVTGGPGHQTLDVTIESDGDGLLPTVRYRLDQGDTAIEPGPGGGRSVLPEPPKGPLPEPPAPPAQLPESFSAPELPEPPAASQLPDLPLAEEVPEPPSAATGEPPAAGASVSERAAEQPEPTVAPDESSSVGAQAHSAVAPHPNSAGTGHPAQPAVNNCVPESLGQVNADQRGSVVSVPDPQPGNPSGRSIDEIRPHLNGAELEGFRTDAAATGHGRIAEGLIHAEGAGPGSTAWVLEQRATVDEHGVGAHAYTLTYVGDNGDGTWAFTLDGVEVTYHGLDAHGRESFSDPDGRRVSLPELAGGSRAEAVDTWAAVWHDRQVVENVGDRTATPPAGRLRVGQTTPGEESGHNPDRPAAHDPPEVRDTESGHRSELVAHAAGETAPDAAARVEAAAGSWDWLGDQLPDWPADKIDDAGLELADLVERELENPDGEVRIVLAETGVPGDRELHATVGDSSFTLTESNRMPPWLADGIEPIRHVRVHVPGEIAIAVDSRKIPQLAKALAAFHHLGSPPEVAQDNIDHGLRHRARINRGRLHGFQTNIEGEFIECRFGDETVELTVYPLWDQDFRTGWRELERAGQHGRTVPIERFADVIVADLRERHANWSETPPDTAVAEEAPTTSQWPDAAHAESSTELTDALTRTATDSPTVERTVLGEPGSRRELVEVTDQSRDLPVRDESDARTESGRVTELLDEKSGSWGFRLHTDGTRTRWFELFESAGSHDAQPTPEPTVDLTFPRGAVEERVGDARRAVVDVLTDWPEEKREGVRLLVSELVTNVARYAPEGRARMRIWLDDTHLRVAVDDASRELPKRQEESDFGTFDVDASEIDLDAWESGALEVGTHGRGLGLLDETASIWGVDVRRDGKTVWFEVDSPLSDVAATDATVVAAAGSDEPGTATETADLEDGESTRFTVDASAGEEPGLLANFLSEPELHTAEIIGHDPTASLLLEERAALLTDKTADVRIREATNGRTAARRALRSLGIPETPILRGPKGEPLWPAGVVGAITHKEGYYAAVVADAAHVRSIGIDAEDNGPMFEGAMRIAARPEEQAWLAEIGQRDGVHWDRVLFSAKESVYKAWYQLTGRSKIGFRDALLTFDVAAGTFHAQLLVDGTTLSGPPVTEMSGRFIVRGDRILTAATVPHEDGHRPEPRQRQLPAQRRPARETATAADPTRHEARPDRSGDGVPERSGWVPEQGGGASARGGGVPERAGGVPEQDSRVPGQYPRSSAEPEIGRTDAELIAAVRTGETAAYGDLFERHAAAARAQARRLVRSPADVDDVVSESFTKVLDVIRKGGGPDKSFRAYLLTTMRNTVHRGPAHSDNRLVFTDDMTQVDPGVPFVDTAVRQLEQSMVAKAFDTLQERWRTALWQTEVEGIQAGEAAPAFGLTPNAFSQLSSRAREALRQAYLQMHISEAPSESCRPTVERLGTWARNGLAKRADAQVRAHLEDCAHCRDIAVQIIEVNSMLGGRSRTLPTGPTGDGSTDHRLPDQSEGT
ncbi:sigma-70 family RNA polymerase sigma factor [Nocardia sp. CA-107356]|uniref:sigma-70 family RNA polymerase sigma factor n=1 Tax=Nocardia sp. CA-107356 TaxID=3239972 RepID=UPI003D9108B8